MSLCCDDVLLGGGAGRKRKQLFVSANRSVSDRNTRGAAKVSPPINRRVHFFSFPSKMVGRKTAAEVEQCVKRVRERSRDGGNVSLTEQ